MFMLPQQNQLIIARPMPSRAISHVLEMAGLAMRRHRALIIGIQWTVVLVYLVLLLVPAFLPLPPEEAGIVASFTRFAQFVFWGLWWPFVILCTMFLGRIWCGVLCPEGALSEWASGYGLGRRIPRWMKWGGWPFVAFAGTTLYGQLASVYEYPKGAAVVLGGSTLAAIGIGLLYGRNKRVWCRHLCPASGVFALLAKIAPIHYEVDRKAWDTAPRGTRTSRAHGVNCAPLIDIRRMETASPCHMCGRCAGERNAVRLTLRSPNMELLRTGNRVYRWEVILLLCGLLGIALGAFQWSASPWFVAAKQQAGAWLVSRDWMWPLQSDAPWWLLTHYPEKNEVFTWLDGALILGYIAATTALVGGWSALCLVVGARLARVSAWSLAYALLPFAGLSVFLGLSALTVTLLRAEGLALTWVGPARAVLLMLGVFWSARIAWGMVTDEGLFSKAIAVTAVLAALSVVVWLWLEMFYFW